MDDFRSPGCPHVTPVLRWMAVGPARLGAMLQGDLPHLGDSLHATQNSKMAWIGCVTWIRPLGSRYQFLTATSTTVPLPRGHCHV